MTNQAPFWSVFCFKPHTLDTLQDKWVCFIKSNPICRAQKITEPVDLGQNYTSDSQSRFCSFSLLSSFFFFFFFVFSFFVFFALFSSSSSSSLPSSSSSSHSSSSLSSSSLSSYSPFFLLCVFTSTSTSSSQGWIWHTPKTAKTPRCGSTPGLISSNLCFFLGWMFFYPLAHEQACLTRLPTKT